MSKALKIFMITFIAILLFATTVYASDFSINANVQKNGNEYIVTLLISEISADLEGVNVFSSTIEYNRDDFEIVKKEDVTGKNKWGEPGYNEETGKMLAFTSDFNRKNNEEVIEIRLKQKDNPKNKEAEIKFLKTEAANSKERILADDITIKFKLDGGNFKVKDIIIYILIGVIVLLVLRIIFRTITKRRKVR